MDNEKKYTTSLRLYKNRPVHAQAYRYLKDYNSDIFRTKDDFIAEAVVYFSKYLKQEEEEKRTEDVNRYFQEKNGPLIEVIRNAVFGELTSQIADLVKKSVREALQDLPPAALEKNPSSEKMDEENDTEKDLQFAQFYEFGDD
ncbi:hypothetical protein H6A65_00380 [Mediterraneibacter glycyrrhizinilyticus]|uniref:hypothetical protein n=1 Tax=Mediterraneibacter glycyrrhizinilyticus TaxID=342942 RepID=UPI00195FD6C2|nr:hypothetical protein [Mediterraneibacter glycyrrhizinilyticus]MBM6749959.1 hypothetical protein [Mediterraneibacter glycyrrhizinilyticus]